MLCLSNQDLCRRGWDQRHRNQDLLVWCWLPRRDLSRPTVSCLRLAEQVVATAARRSTGGGCPQTSWRTSGSFPTSGGWTRRTTSGWTRTSAPSGGNKCFWWIWKGTDCRPQNQISAWIRERWTKWTEDPSRVWSETLASIVLHSWAWWWQTLWALFFKPQVQINVTIYNRTVLSVQKFSNVNSKIQVASYSHWSVRSLLHH